VGWGDLLQAPLDEETVAAGLREALAVGTGRAVATIYFRNATENSLRARFQPIVADTMGEIGLYYDYESLLDLYDLLPFTDKPSLNLTEYITDRTLDGLFQTLASEEGRIRCDHVARTSALLKRVFGGSLITNYATNKWISMHYELTIEQNKAKLRTVLSEIWGYPYLMCN